MSGPDPNATQPPEAAAARATAAAQQPQPQPPQPRQPDSAPFQSQLEYLSQQQQLPPNVPQYGQQPFDMGSMAGALPGQPQMPTRPYASPDPSQGVASPNPYQQPTMFPPTQPGGPRFADPTMLARAQQQQFMSAQYGAPSPIQNMQRQNFPMQQQVPFSPVDPYAFGINPAQYSPIDPRFGPPGSFVLPAGLPTDIAQFARRGSADTAPIPSFPRGPPRKPKQSGHALWVGNLPPQALVTDLKDHFSRDATTDIESVFLIAKSNCAFVNYRTEAACVAAMNRFHDSRFHGVRLVCRLRRGTASSAAATPTAEEAESPPEPATATIEKDEDALSPTIARSQSHQSDVSNKSGNSPGAPPASDEKVPEKYFIVKSLTAQDLEASVRNGIWATQSHNEDALNRAYSQADNVYLIFSANKSGEYFGYARMASTISGEAVDLSSTFPSAQEAATDPAGSPQSIPTPATATAPKGRIIDDSARGTIFWEADHSEDEEGAPEKDGTGQNWGKQFQIEWVSTNRLPFYRTRGLRNPWNANREVKIARDGTELEPSVGRRLVQMFHRPSPSPSASGPGGPPPGNAPPGTGMPFR
ncbi:hypothetical protein M409DRAFT_21102 [Zasmidium cellare ATCC 36951]|uniref:YTH domain-containing protein n=1 Tax=Zasmidium cellare ATCC 36951 TaxID=1080233 RepID=A0A6A6CPU7_ZASCE|nr:uncharacterized protein M409DRAFT_21102 [Zasmidium cellare ATCC 36951]KAF2169091.1 hypothetical protein M409DRAFT_21102 [Zasmidium cellare ATCC 36951]